MFEIVQIRLPALRCNKRVIERPEMEGAHSITGQVVGGRFQWQQPICLPWSLYWSNEGIILPKFIPQESIHYKRIHTIGKLKAMTTDGKCQYSSGIFCKSHQSNYVFLPCFITFTSHKFEIGLGYPFRLQYKIMANLPHRWPKIHFNGNPPIILYLHIKRKILPRTPPYHDSHYHIVLRLTKKNVRISHCKAIKLLCDTRSKKCCP